MKSVPNMIRCINDYDSCHRVQNKIDKMNEFLREVAHQIHNTSIEAHFVCRIWVVEVHKATMQLIAAGSSTRNRSV